MNLRDIIIMPLLKAATGIKCETGSSATVEVTVSNEVYERLCLEYEEDPAGDSLCVVDRVTVRPERARGGAR